MSGALEIGACPRISNVILSLVVSTIAFFAASYFIKRRFDEMDLPKGRTRGITIFVMALAVAYGVAWGVGWITGA